MLPLRRNIVKKLIEQAVPAVVDAALQERAKVALTQNKRYPHRKGFRNYLLAGLISCAACGAACSGHPSTKRGKRYYYHTCHVSRTNKPGAGRSHKPPYVSAGWLEELVWADLRRFMANPGEVLERVREQLNTGDNTEELEARRAELAKRLTARHAEKDRYVRLYAQGHLSEEELDAYLAGLKNQTENIRLLLESVEDELSRGRDQAKLAETAHAWLLTLRQRIAEVEEDTQDAFRARRQLTRLLVAGITVGKTHEGDTEVRVTYRFGPPPGEDYSEVGGEEDYSSVEPFKNGSMS